MGYRQRGCSHELVDLCRYIQVVQQWTNCFLITQDEVFIDDIQRNDAVFRKERLHGRFAHAAFREYPISASTTSKVSLVNPPCGLLGVAAFRLFSQHLNNLVIAVAKDLLADLCTIVVPPSSNNYIFVSYRKTALPLPHVTVGSRPQFRTGGFVPSNRQISLTDVHEAILMA